MPGGADLISDESTHTNSGNIVVIDKGWISTVANQIPRFASISLHLYPLSALLLAPKFEPQCPFDVSLTPIAPPDIIQTYQFIYLFIFPTCNCHRISLSLRFYCFSSLELQRVFMRISFHKFRTQSFLSPPRTRHISTRVWTQARHRVRTRSCSPSIRLYDKHCDKRARSDSPPAHHRY